MKNLESSLKSAEGDIDFLLTCEWPEKVTALCAPGCVPEGLDPRGVPLTIPLHVSSCCCVILHCHMMGRLKLHTAFMRAGSSVVSTLALSARPRYHVAACKGTFFARVPYLNKDLGAGQQHPSLMPFPS